MPGKTHQHDTRTPSEGGIRPAQANDGPIGDDQGGGSAGDPSGHSSRIANLRGQRAVSDDIGKVSKGYEGRGKRGATGPSLRAQLLGKLMREYRERAGIKTSEAGDYIQRSQATLSRIESGTIPARPPDVMALLNLYGVDDRSTREALECLSRDAWRKGWWCGNSEYLDHWFIDIAWLEERASALRLYDAILVPGILQTREYAETANRAVDIAVSARLQKQGLEFRMRRQRILEQEEPTEVTAILDASVLRRTNGNAAALHGQLRHLADLAHRPNIEILVLPAGSPMHAGLTGTFAIFERLEPYSVIAYSETLAGAMYVEDTKAEPFVRAYDELRKAAYDIGESLALIEHAAAELE